MNKFVHKFHFCHIGIEKGKPEMLKLEPSDFKTLGRFYSPKECDYNNLCFKPPRHLFNVKTEMQELKGVGGCYTKCKLYQTLPNVNRRRELLRLPN